MFDEGLPAVNAAQAALGLLPFAGLLDQLAAADRLLLATSRAFDFPANLVPDGIRYIGPQLDEPAWVEPWAADDPWRLVLVAPEARPTSQATSTPG